MGPVRIRHFFVVLVAVICLNFDRIKSLNTSNSSSYVGTLIGKLSELHHQVSGEIYAVDSRTIYIKDFNYDGQGPAAYFYVGTSRTPSNHGAFRVPDETGSTGVLKPYNHKSITLTLPEGKTLGNIRWFSVWCDEFSVNFGDVKIPQGYDYPKPLKIQPLLGVHEISSDNIVIVDAQTLLIPNLSYDGEAPDAKFWVGVGPKPSPQGWRVPDENGKEIPLRRYDKKTVVLTLPHDLTVFDIDYFGIWCEAFTVDFGHVKIPKRLNVPPSLKMLGVSPQSKLNCEVLDDNLAYEIRWAVAGDSIVIQLVAKLDENEYMAFGLSGDDDHSVMVGGDTVVTWVNQTTSKGYAVDYYLDSKSQCSGSHGSCPDERLQEKTNNVRLLNAAMVNGYSIVTYQRTLKAHDNLDRAILTSKPQPIIWAIGPLNQRNEVSFHSHWLKGDRFLNFGRQPKWNCPTPKSDRPTSTPRADTLLTYTENRRKTNNIVPQQQLIERELPLPKQVGKMEPWDIPAVQCNEPDDGVFYAQMGPTGGKRGYSAITGHVGWGISWYINGLLIPEIHVVRGTTYTFVVEGGNNPNIPARYHPFYITDDPVGGYEHKSDQEKQTVHIYAGAVNTARGPAPTGTGRLCHWTPQDNTPPENFASFGAYQRTLKLICDPGDPGIITWTPDDNTPDTVYYQCFTHRYLGWKIHVHDRCDQGPQAQGSEQIPVAVPAVSPRDGKVRKYKVVRRPKTNIKLPTTTSKHVDDIDINSIFSVPSKSGVINSGIWSKANTSSGYKVELNKLYYPNVVNQPNQATETNQEANTAYIPDEKVPQQLENPLRFNTSATNTVSTVVKPVLTPVHQNQTIRYNLVPIKTIPGTIPYMGYKPYPSWSTNMVPVLRSKPTKGPSMISTLLKPIFRYAQNIFEVKSLPTTSELSENEVVVKPLDVQKPYNLQNRIVFLNPYQPHFTSLNPVSGITNRMHKKYAPHIPQTYIPLSKSGMGQHPLEEPLKKAIPNLSLVKLNNLMHLNGKDKDYHFKNLLAKAKTNLVNYLGGDEVVNDDPVIETSLETEIGPYEDTAWSKDFHTNNSNLPGPVKFPNTGDGTSGLAPFPKLHQIDKPMPYNPHFNPVMHAINEPMVYGNSLSRTESRLDTTNTRTGAHANANGFLTLNKLKSPLVEKTNDYHLMEEWRKQYQQQYQGHQGYQQQPVLIDINSAVSSTVSPSLPDDSSLDLAKYRVKPHGLTHTTAVPLSVKGARKKKPLKEQFDFVMEFKRSDDRSKITYNGDGTNKNHLNVPVRSLPVGFESISSKKGFDPESVKIERGFKPVYGNEKEAEDRASYGDDVIYYDNEEGTSNFKSEKLTSNNNKEKSQTNTNTNKLYTIYQPDKGEYEIDDLEYRNDYDYDYDTYMKYNFFDRYKYVPKKTVEKIPVSKVVKCKE